MAGPASARLVLHAHCSTSKVVSQPGGDRLDQGLAESIAAPWLNAGSNAAGLLTRHEQLSAAHLHPGQPDFAY